MKAGKLSESALKRSVLKQLHNGKSFVPPMVGQSGMQWSKTSGYYDDSAFADILQRK